MTTCNLLLTLSHNPQSADRVRYRFVLDRDDAHTHLILPPLPPSLPQRVKGCGTTQRAVDGHTRLYFVTAAASMDVHRGSCSHKV